MRMRIPDNALQRQRQQRMSALSPQIDTEFSYDLLGFIRTLLVEHGRDINLTTEQMENYILAIEIPDFLSSNAAKSLVEQLRAWH